MLTKEHIYPVWSFEMFDIPDTKFNPSTRLKSVLHERYTAKVLEDEKKLDSDHFISYRDFTVKAVCEKCNGGWMSELEGRVKKIFTLLMGDKSIEELSVTESFDLARWSILKIILISKTAQFPFEFDHLLLQLLKYNYIPDGFIVEALRVDQKGFNYQISEIDALPADRIDQEELTLAQENSFLGILHFGHFAFRISYLKTSISIMRVQLTERLISLYPFQAQLPFIEGEIRWDKSKFTWDQVVAILGIRLRLSDHYAHGSESFLFIEEGFLPLENLIKKNEIGPSS